MNASDVVSIKEHEERLLNAMKNGNVEVVDELLHDDLLFVIPTGQTVTKEADLENMKSGILKIDDLASSELEVSVIGDNAITSVLVDLKGSYAGHPINGKFKYLRNWKRFDSTWKVIGGAGIEIK